MWSPLSNSFLGNLKGRRDRFRGKVDQFLFSGDWPGVVFYEIQTFFLLKSFSRLKFALWNSN